MNHEGVILGSAYNFFPQYPESFVSFVLTTSGRKADVSFADARVVPEPGFVAWDVSDDGTMIGSLSAPEETFIPVIYQSGRMTELPAAVQGGRCWGLDINNRGQILGIIAAADATGQEQVRAAIWSGGRIQDLGVLPGFAKSYAFAINDSGEAVGYCYDALTPEAAFGGFIYRNGVMTRLATIPGASDNNPVLINNRGDVVIEFWFAREGYARHSLYSGGTLVDLEAIVSKALEMPLYAMIIFDMNDRGEIIGTAQYADGLGTRQPFLIVPQGPSNDDHR
jgi:hypothetical protein